MRDICANLSTKINVNVNSLVFLYGGGILNLEKTFEDLTKESKICILVDKYEDEEICPKCGRLLKNEIINEIILSNNNINFSLIGIKGKIELIINNKTNVNNINSQLKDINDAINNINDEFKKINNKLNLFKLNKNNDNKKKELLKNEIKCIYNKQENVIDLLHDYSYDLEAFDNEEEGYILYREGKNNINEKNIDTLKYTLSS